MSLSAALWNIIKVAYGTYHCMHHDISLTLYILSMIFSTLHLVCDVMACFIHPVHVTNSDAYISGNYQVMTSHTYLTQCRRYFVINRIFWLCCYWTYWWQDIDLIWICGNRNHIIDELKFTTENLHLLAYHRCMYIMYVCRRIKYM